jgi:hypothetical protein
MKRKIWPLLTIMALMACRPSETQLFPHHSPDPLPPDPAPQASDLTADQLIAKYEAARGGEPKLKAIQSVKMTGSWSANVGSSSTITVLITPGHYLRRIAQGADVTMMSSVDGAATWEVIPRNGITKPTPMSAKDAARFRHLADPQGPFVDAKAKGNKVEVIGKQPWRDSQVYKLKVTYADGGASNVYLDARSFLPVRIVNNLFVAQLNKNIDSESVYQDFRDVNGVKWPFTEKVNVPEANFTQAITWSKIEVNQPLDASAFKAPKG